MAGPIFPSRYQYEVEVTLSGAVGTAVGKTGQETPNLARFFFQPRPDNIRLTVGEGDRFWHLAQRAWPQLDLAGTYWWVVPLYNGLLSDPTLKLEAGTPVFLPSLRALFQDLLGRSL